MQKVRVIIKRPDEQYGHVTNISTSLKNLQKTVEGYLEMVRIKDGVVMLINEDGKYCCKPRNFQYGLFPENTIIAGVAVIAGDKDGEFVDCPLEFTEWKEMLKSWGNV